MKKRAGKNNSNYRHGLISHPLYQVWKRIKLKCYNENHATYLGGSINVCQEWRNDFSCFYNWAINYWFKGSALWRKNLTLDYCPDNCYFDNKANIARINGNISIQKLKGIKRSKATDAKIRATNLKRYGVETPFESKQILQKAIQTNLSRYGVANPAILKEIKLKTKHNNLKKYGVDYPQQLEINRAKSKKATIESGQANFYNGKTSDELAAQIGISRSCMNARIRKYGFEQAVSMDKRQSELEHLIAKLLINKNIQFKQNTQLGKYRPDFILEQKKIIIEADGLYWHSEAINDNKYYHRDKLNFYESLGYRAFFFREDEINKKFDIVKSIINNSLNSTTKIYGRKCFIKEVDAGLVKIFLNENHLMGYGKGRGFGLFNDNKLVGLMQIIDKKTYIDISRFCVLIEHNIIGGFSKLLKYINSLYNRDIHTFIDRRYGQGFYLPDMGFEKVNEDISFVWVKNDVTYHRLQYPGNSGRKYGLYKLWDCGQAKYIKKFAG